MCRYQGTDPIDNLFEYIEQARIVKVRASGLVSLAHRFSLITKGEDVAETREVGDIWQFRLDEQQLKGNVTKDTGGEW